MMTEEEMVQQHIPLVKSVVGLMSRNLPPYVDADELFSSGLIGLLHAVRRYDPTRNASFETYAGLRIRGAILDDLRRMDWVPRSIHAKAAQLREMDRRLTAELGREPTSAEMAAAMGLTLEQFLELKESTKPVSYVRLDEPIGDDADTAFDMPDPAQRPADVLAADGEASELLHWLLAQLPEQEREIVTLYFLHGWKLHEIGSLNGFCETRALQLRDRGLQLLRESLGTLTKEQVLA